MNLALQEQLLPVRIRLSHAVGDGDFLRFSSDNRPLRMELEPDGQILIMTPTGNRTGRMNMRIGRLLDEWAESDGRGVTFDSGTGFKLANGSVRSPDAAWVSRVR